MPSTLPNDISLNGLNFTRAQEGRALRAYQDSVGCWTVGYGLTNYDKNLPWKVEKGLVISEDQAEWYLVESIRKNYLPAARKALMGGTYAHPQGAVDGTTDMHFNTGGVLKASWPKALGRGDLAAAKAALMSWNKAGGRVLSGLTRRREGNWLEVSAEQYGHLTGPAIVLPNASNHEIIRGNANLLSAFPTDPNDRSSGQITTHADIPMPTTEAPGVLKEGMVGPEVTDAQTDLANAGYPVTAAGNKFTAEMTAAVLAFQNTHPNLTADGKIGPATAAALKRAADMRAKANTVLKTAAPVIPGMYVGFHQWVSAHAGDLALMVGLSAVVVIGGYLLWKHRHDAHAWFNGLVGRVVP